MIVKVANGSVTQTAGAKSLGITTRQVRRLVCRYKSDGVEALLHQGRNKPSNHRSDERKRDEVMGLVRLQYSDCGPTLISDELRDLHDIVFPPETIRRWMIQDGLWTVDARGKESHRRWRERKASYGELCQMDTSKHMWFGPDRGYMYLIAMIDDATSRMFARFYREDSTLTNMDLIARYIALHGRPLAIYTDRASHFVVNPKGSSRMPLELAETAPETQIQRALGQLGIHLSIAHSPQAKGRVERLFGTLQKRLLPMFTHRGITTIEEANDFLSKKFIPDWDRRYARPPMTDIDLHRPAEGHDLGSILSVQESRVVTNDYTFQHGGWRLQIESRDVDPRMRRNKVIIEQRTDGSVRTRFNDKYIHVVRVERIKR
jgi:hypothetical protein